MVSHHSTAAFSSTMSGGWERSGRLRASASQALSHLGHQILLQFVIGLMTCIHGRAGFLQILTEKVLVWHSLAKKVLTVAMYKHTQSTVGSSGLAELACWAVVLRGWTWRCFNDTDRELSLLSVPVLETKRDASLHLSLSRSFSWM